MTSPPPRLMTSLSLLRPMISRKACCLIGISPIILFLSICAGRNHSRCFFDVSTASPMARQTGTARRAEYCQSICRHILLWLNKRPPGSRYGVLSQLRDAGSSCRPWHTWEYDRCPGSSCRKPSSQKTMGGLFFMLSTGVGFIGAR